MKKIKFHLFLTIILLISGLLLCEALSRIYLKYSTGSYRISQKFKEKFSEESKVKEQLLKKQPIALNLSHGYTHTPDYSITEFIPSHVFRQYLQIDPEDPMPQISWFDMKANNYGFMSYYDYPYEKKENEFVVGIWGGSVAYWMAIMGNDPLKKYLKKYFKQKEIVILNFAQGGMKQPQSLSVLSYFHSIGQKIDAAIFLDGFNEVYYAQVHNYSNWAISAPSIDWVAGVYQLANRQWSPEYLLLFYNSIKSKNQQHYFESRETSFASVSLIQKAIAVYYKNKYIRNYAKLLEYKGQIDDLIFLPPRLTHEEESPYETVAEIWKNATIAAKSIVSSEKDSIFVHAIQPSRYFPSEFADETPQNKYFATTPKDGYPHLIQASEDLRKNYKIASLDLTGLFNKKEDRVGIFADACCHFTIKGNDMIAKVIASEIIKIFKSKSLSNPIKK